MSEHYLDFFCGCYLQGSAWRATHNPYCRKHMACPGSLTLRFPIPHFRNTNKVCVVFNFQNFNKHTLPLSIKHHALVDSRSAWSSVTRWSDPCHTPPIPDVLVLRVVRRWVDCRVNPTLFDTVTGQRSLVTVHLSPHLALPYSVF